MNRRVAAYLRYSSTLQRPTSIDDQLRNIRRMVADEGDTLVEEFIFRDEAVSGTTEAGREGFQAMKEAILRRPPPVDALAVDDLSRLGRDQVDVGGLHRQLRFRGIELMAVAGFRSSAPSADLAFGVQTLLDQQYSRDLAHKTRRGLVGQALRGNHTGGRVYGYRSIALEPAGGAARGGEGTRLVIDEEQAAVVRRIFALRLEGRSLDAIVAVLAGENLPAPDPGNRPERKKGWSRSSVQYLLKNPLYKGTRIFNQSEFIKNPDTGKRLSRPRPRDQWIVTHHPELAIVSDEVFDRAQEVSRQKAGPRSRAGRYQGRYPGQAYSPHLLSGLLKCGICGGAMVLRGGKPNRRTGKTDYRGYGCPSRKDRGPQSCSNTLSISQAKLEAAITDEIKRKLLDPAAIAFYVREFKRAFEAEQKNTGSEKAIRKLEKALAGVQKKIDNLLDYLKSFGASARVNSELRAAEAEHAELTRDLEDLRGEGTSALSVPPEKAIVDGLEHLRATLAEDPAEAGKLLRALVGHLTMTPRYPEGWAGSKEVDEEAASSEAEEGAFLEGGKGASPEGGNGEGAFLQATNGKGSPQERESRSPWYEVTGSAFLTNLLVPTAGMAFRGCGGGI